MKRNVFVRPEIIELAADELLQVMKPLYGLTESGDYFEGKQLSDHHKKDLKIDASHGDLSLFFKSECGKLVCISGAYVSDLLRAGNKQFCQESTKQHHLHLRQNHQKNPSQLHWVGNIRITDRVTPKSRELCETIVISQEKRLVPCVPLFACKTAVSRSFSIRHCLCSIYVY